MRRRTVNRRGEIILAAAIIVAGALVFSSLIVAYKPRVLISVKNEAVSPEPAPALGDPSITDVFADAKLSEGPHGGSPSR